RDQPLVEPQQSLAHADPWRPPRRRLELARIRDVVTLIPQAPTLVDHLRHASAQIADHPDQFEEAHRVLHTPADIEDLAGKLGATLDRQEEGIYQITHVEGVPDLQAIAVEGDRGPRQSPDQEMRDPPLVLGAELMR